MEIIRGDLTDQRIVALLRHHFDKCHDALVRQIAADDLHVTP